MKTLVRKARYVFWFQRSLMAADKGEYEKSLHFFEKSGALKLYPMLSAAYKARILMMLRQLDSAAQYVRHQLEGKDEKMLEGDELLGMIYMLYIKAVLEGNEDEVQNRKSQARNIYASKLAKDCLQIG